MWTIIVLTKQIKSTDPEKVFETLKIIVSVKQFSIISYHSMISMASVQENYKVVQVYRRQFVSIQPM